MGSLFDGTDNVIFRFLGVDRNRLNNKTTRVKSINDKESLAFISEMYEILERNYRQVGSKPRSTSRELWRCKPIPSINIDDKKNQSDEKILEKAVAMLSARGHMHEWFNQCPVAAGITDPYKDNKRAVDLVHWSESDRHVRLVELKWKSNTPLYALFEVLEYGLAYIFCRVHKRELPLQCPSLMNAHHVSLEVAAPLRFYSDYNEKDRFTQTSKSLDQFAASKTGGTLSMSLNALAFPKEFDLIPFNDGDDVKLKCDSRQLTAEGLKVRNAFNNLTPVWP